MIGLGASGPSNVLCWCHTRRVSRASYARLTRVKHAWCCHTRRFHARQTCVSDVCLHRVGRQMENKTNLVLLLVTIVHATWKSNPMRKIYNEWLDLVADIVFTLAGLLRLFSWQSWPWVTLWGPWPINIVFSWAVYCQDSATFIKVRRGQTFLFGTSS